MKKILLGTTGLVGAALLASAASAETPKVTLGGFSDFQAGYTDDRGATQNAYGFRNDNEVIIKVDGKTDGGLGYGAQIDLEADVTADANNQGVNAARTFTYLSGNWGRVELGSNKSAAATIRVDASSLAVATGGINGSWVYFVSGNNLAGAGATGSGFITQSKLEAEHGSTLTSGDETTYNATKITYYTPKYAGFQIGVSYTPQLADRGQLLSRADNAGLKDVVDAGISYENTFFGAWKFAAAATGEWASSTGAAVPFASGNTTSVPYGTDDVSSYNVGALVGYKGFQIAGSYGDWDESGIAGVSGNYYTGGIGYETGPIGLSATWINSSLDDAAGSTNKFNNIVLGADYKLAPGLTPYAEVSFFDYDSGPTAGATTNYNNTGTSVILGTQVAF